MIYSEDNGSIRTFRLAHGKASALDLELLVELERMVDEFISSPAKAAILTGTGGIFSAGVDLRRLVEGGDDYLDAFLPALESAFQALFLCPKPVVVACNGHAIAGGCVLLSCGDVRLAASGRGRIGVPELRVGVPFPRTALELIRFAVGSQHAQSVLLLGDTYDVETASRVGLIDRVVPADELQSEATRIASQLASSPPEAFRQTKRLLRAPVAEVIRHGAEEDAAETRALWASTSPFWTEHREKRVIVTIYFSCMIFCKKTATSDVLHAGCN